MSFISKFTRIHKSLTRKTAALVLGISLSLIPAFSLDELATAAPAITPVAAKSPGDTNVIQAWGKTFNYSKTLDVSATAYSAAPEENGGWGAVDYFGNPLQIGSIAVDPKVIPMGTKVLVTGHNSAGLPKNSFVAIACDQGGGIKGNRIDIFVPGDQSLAVQFGIQNVKLYVLN